MTLLLTPKARPASLDPPTRSASWLAALWRLAPDGAYTPEQADAIVRANWTRSPKQMRQHGVIVP